MFGRVLILVAIMTMIATSVFASGMGEPTMRAQMWDISVQTRYSGSITVDGEENSKSEIDSDLGWGFGFGYNVDERFNVGFLFNWRSATYTSTVTPEDSGEDVEVYTNWLDVATLGLSGEWNMLPKRTTPYIMAVLGWTFFDTNIPADLYGGCWYDPWYGYVCSGTASTYGTDAVSYSIGAGLRAEVSETVYLRIGYEYDGADLDGASGVNIFRFDIGFMQ